MFNVDLISPKNGFAPHLEYYKRPFWYIFENTSKSPQKKCFKMMWQAGCVGSVEFKLKMGSGQKKVIQISLKQIGSTHKFSHEFF